MKVLQLLRDVSEGLYGLELVKASGGNLKRGTVYVVLSRMEDKGYVEARVRRDAAHAGLPRPRYKLTALGERVLKAADIMRIDSEGAYA